MICPQRQGRISAAEIDSLCLEGMSLVRNVSHELCFKPTQFIQRLLFFFFFYFIFANTTFSLQMFCNWFRRGRRHVMCMADSFNKAMQEKLVFISWVIGCHLAWLINLHRLIKGCIGWLAQATLRDSDAFSQLISMYMMYCKKCSSSNFWNVLNLNRHVWEFVF